ncbi:hypothetical protein F5887DRAFT_1156910 [Amanita rubescens]|nr:hypothetical protein F5887DRAFT_1156910 [Amanita rubescens]
MNGVTTTTCESMAQKTLLTWMRAKEKRAKISTGRVLDFATKHGSDAEEKLPTMLIRGRRQPSITSSDPDVYIAPGSSTSSAAKISPGFGSNLKRSLQIDMKDLVDDSVACRFGGDGSYHIANATSAADSNGTSTHTSGDIPTSSSSASLTRQMEMTKSAMHDGPVDSRHSDPNRTTIGTFGVGIDGSAAHLPSLAPIDPSANRPIFHQFNPGMK